MRARVGTAPAPAPHAPEESVWRRRLGRFYVTGIFWYRFHATAAWWLPVWVLRAAAVPFHLFFLLTLGKVRAAVASNLDVVLGRAGFLRRVLRVRRTFWNFALCLNERYRRVRVGPRTEWLGEGIDHWTDVADREGGFIVVTGHIGNWESGSVFPTMRQPREVHVVREAEGDPRAQRFLEELLRKRGVEGYRTHFAGNDPGLGFELLRALRDGAVVALQGDRPRAGGRTVTVPFFGRATAFPVGTAALARAAGVPILPAFVFRTAWDRPRIVFRPRIDVDPDGGDEALDRAVSAIAREVEWAIRREPYQWFCFRRLW